MHRVARFKLFFILQPALCCMGYVLMHKYHPFDFTRLSSFLKSGKMSRFCWNKSKILSSEQDPAPAGWRELRGTHAERGYSPGSFLCLPSSLSFPCLGIYSSPLTNPFLQLTQNREMFALQAGLWTPTPPRSFALRYEADV